MTNNVQAISGISRTANYNASSRQCDDNRMGKHKPQRGTQAIKTMMLRAYCGTHKLMISVALAEQACPSRNHALLGICRLAAEGWQIRLSRQFSGGSGLPTTGDAGDQPESDPDESRNAVAVQKVKPLIPAYRTRCGNTAFVIVFKCCVLMAVSTAHHQ